MTLQVNLVCVVPVFVTGRRRRRRLELQVELQVKEYSPAYSLPVSPTNMNRPRLPSRVGTGSATGSGSLSSTGTWHRDWHWLHCQWQITALRAGA